MHTDSLPRRARIHNGQLFKCGCGGEKLGEEPRRPQQGKKKKLSGVFSQCTTDDVLSETATTPAAAVRTFTCGEIFFPQSFENVSARGEREEVVEEEEEEGVMLRRRCCVGR